MWFQQDRATCNLYPGVFFRPVDKFGALFGAQSFSYNLKFPSTYSYKLKDLFWRVKKVSQNGVLAPHFNKLDHLLNFRFSIEKYNRLIYWYVQYKKLFYGCIIPKCL